LTATFRFCSIIANISTELANASKSPPVFSTTGTELCLQLPVRFTRGAHVCNLITAHVSTEATAGTVRDEIVRDVFVSASTAAIRFAAPDPHGCDVTGQHLNGWILIFVFVGARHCNYKTLPTIIRANSHDRILRHVAEEKVNRLRSRRAAFIANEIP
jgi:hypothetical protein